MSNKVKAFPARTSAPAATKPQIEPALVGINDAAAYLGLGRTRIYELIGTELEAVRIGSRTLVKVSSLKALAERAEPVVRAA
jgi:excisionase family DNA binding protein